MDLNLPLNDENLGLDFADNIHLGIKNIISSQNVFLYIFNGFFLILIETKNIFTQIRK